MQQSSSPLACPGLAWSKKATWRFFSRFSVTSATDQADLRRDKSRRGLHGERRRRFQPAFRVGFACEFLFARLGSDSGNRNLPNIGYSGGACIDARERRPGRRPNITTQPPQTTLGAYPFREILQPGCLLRGLGRAIYPGQTTQGSVPDKTPAKQSPGKRNAVDRPSVTTPEMVSI
mgnify:CR=1 FL=1